MLMIRKNFFWLKIWYQNNYFSGKKLLIVNLFHFFIYLIQEISLKHYKIIEKSESHFFWMLVVLACCRFKSVVMMLSDLIWCSIW